MSRHRSVSHATAHDWLSLVALSGLVVSEPVLLSYFEEGPPPIAERLVYDVRREWQHYTLGRGDKQDSYDRWLTFVLERLLDWPHAHIRRHSALPDAVKVFQPEYAQTLAPYAALVDDDDAPLVLLWRTERDFGLDQAETGRGKWRASAAVKLERVLRETRVPFGLVTNGREWRVIHAQAGYPTASITWTANVWLEERSTLDAFALLLGCPRFFPPMAQEKMRLLGLVQESAKKQTDVTDQLGQQVRHAIEKFVRALDDADHTATGALLDTSGMQPGADGKYTRLYEMALTVMMRLVFVLYAEENRLLPHGEPLYDDGYGLTRLWSQLEREMNAGQLDTHDDAWLRVLALVRLIYDGCRHPDLNLRAHGGRLFDPRRFPTLEDARLTIPNAVMRELLYHLTFARVKQPGRGKLGGKLVTQRVSYRTLDVEQIGYMYEGLIDYTVMRAPADEPLLVYKGDAQPIRPMRELLDAARVPAKLIGYLAQQIGKNEKEVAKMLAKSAPRQNALIADDAADSDELPAEITPELRARLQPYDAFIRIDDTIMPGRLYVTQGGMRKGSGTYYTPQWITSFIAARTLEPLVYGTPGNRASLKQPEDILNLKICDPAMGSGAFLVQACRYLAERLMDTWDRAVADKPGQPLTLPYGKPSSGAAGEQLLPISRPNLDSAQSRLARIETQTWARRYIAEHCLYGVDINPLAVDLARLSLWLFTLSVDKPFTFLDHRLKCGNSLVGAHDLAALEYLPSRDTKKRSKADLYNAMQGNVQLSMIFEEAFNKALAVVLNDYRQIDDLATLDRTALAWKTRWVAEIDAQLQPFRDAADIWTATYFGVSVNPADYGALISTLQGPVPVWNAVLGRPALAEARQTLPQGGKPFHWRLEFPDVFFAPPGQQAHGGFDAIIGNPPYVRQELLKPLKDFLVTYTVFAASADLFTYFYELALRLLLRPGGRFGSISSSTFTRTAGGHNIREYLKTHATLMDFVDFGDLQVFAGVTTYPAVTIATKHPPAADHTITSVQVPSLDDTDLIRLISSSSLRVPQRSLAPDAWRFENRAVAHLRDKLAASGVPLKEYTNGQIYRGVLTGLNDAFVIDGATRAQLIANSPKDAPLIKPFLEGKDLKPWRTQPRDLWLIFTRRGTDIDQYPAIKAHLEQYRERLEPKPADWDDRKAWPGRKAGRYKWFEIQDDVAYWQKFENNKIICGRFMEIPLFVYDEAGSYTNDAMYFIPHGSLYVYAILNSSIGWFILKGLCHTIQNGWIQVFVQFLERIPIPRMSAEQEKQIIQAVQDVRKFSIDTNISTAETKTSSQHKKLLRQLNQKVAMIYHLTEDELALAEEQDIRLTS